MHGLSNGAPRSAAGGDAGSAKFDADALVNGDVKCCALVLTMAKPSVSPIERPTDRPTDEPTDGLPDEPSVPPSASSSAKPSNEATLAFASQTTDVEPTWFSSAESSQRYTMDCCRP